ncbi:MAG: FAD-binding oxidoreductase [Pseudomonadota bacterium]
MKDDFPYNDLSAWLREPEDKQPALNTDTDADYVVVGAGFAGLSTALNLKEQGCDVALIEKDFAGSGASGRNAGHVAPTIGKDIPSLIKSFGDERARGLVSFAEAAVEYIEDTIDRYDIACEYERTGNIVAGVLPNQEESLRKASDAAASVGAHVSFLTDNDMRQRGLPRAFRFGFHEESGGHLNPGLYVNGLRDQAIRAGVRLYEDSPLLSLEEGKKVVARTPKGSVTADAAILTTNAYTKSTGKMKRAVTPLRVTLFETAPLSDEQMQAVGWFRREGIYSAHEILENYRFTARNTILGGSRTFRSGFGGSLPKGYHPPTFKVLETMFRDRFPTLKDLPIDQYWGGWIGITPDFLPRIGVRGAHENVYYGIGFNGHGVPQATLTGKLLADKATGNAHAYETALARRAFGWPPEPFLSLGGKSLSFLMHVADRHTDRKIRALAQSSDA